MRLDAVKSRQYIRLCVNGKELLGMPDTGSTVNFMSTAMYWRDFSHLPLRQRNVSINSSASRILTEGGGRVTTGVVQLCVRLWRQNICILISLWGNPMMIACSLSAKGWQDEMRLNIGYDLAKKKSRIYGSLSGTLVRSSERTFFWRSRTRRGNQLPIAESSSQLDFTLIPLHSVEVKSGEVMEASEVHVPSGWLNDASQDNDRLWLLPGGIRVPRAYLVTWKDCLVSVGVFAFGGPSRSKDSYFEEDFRTNAPGRGIRIWRSPGIWTLTTHVSTPEGRTNVPARGIRIRRSPGTWTLANYVPTPEWCTSWSGRHHWFDHRHQ